DEPTNHLDRSGLEFLTAQISNRAGGVAVVSHDRALLTDFAETIVDVDPTPDGRVRIYGNGYEGARDGRAGELARWEQAYEKEQAEHALLEASLESAQSRLVDKWRLGKGTPKHARTTRAGGTVKAFHRRQEDLAAHAITVPEPPQESKFPAPRTRQSASLLAVDHVTVTGRLASPLASALAQRGRLVTSGSNRAPKAIPLKVTSGHLTPATGPVSLPPGTRGGCRQPESNLPDE